MSAVARRRVLLLIITLAALTAVAAVFLAGDPVALAGRNWGSTSWDNLVASTTWDDLLPH